MIRLPSNSKLPTLPLPRTQAFISNIAELWKPNSYPYKVAADYLTKLDAAERTLTAEQISRIHTAIGRLGQLAQYPFNALVLTTDAGVDTVAEVFVRINGQGSKLNQADFILTLMSVFWEEGRKDLEAFGARRRRSTRRQT